MSAVNYSLKTCENLISKYINVYSGECTVLREGVLGLGKILLHNADGKKSIIINEFFINAWASGHTIRKYNKLPKKYLVEPK
tara:strand:+ start:425 stop:670 length:246 start_codon:yes stop_codon:yes gene_type:complete